MHVITGLPRSGSTLLCNILNQNPRFYASSTSVLPILCAVMVKQWSDSPEITGALDRNGQQTREQLSRSLRAFCDAWYQHKQDAGKEVIFDKSRAWTNNLMVLRVIYPDSKVIVLVRDLREVFASVEKQHQKEPLFNQSTNGVGKTMWNRADTMFASDGLIGSAAEGTLDVVRRRLDALVVPFERLVDTPRAILTQIYEYLDEGPFDHNFEDVKNTAEDVDALYLNKYPHNGSGAVRPTTSESWKESFTDDLGETIMQRFPAYNQVFGYS